jgi:predicted Zn finger-like uncharacterized protein
MIIECEKCHAKFNFDENLMKETGTKLRCSSCRHVFVAFPAAKEPQIEQPPPDELADTGEIAKEEISRKEEPLSDFDETIAEEVGQEEVKIGVEEEEIEAISFDDLPQLDSGVIRKAVEEESLDVDEAMDRAERVEEEVTAQKETGREDELEAAEEPLRPSPIIKKGHRSGLWLTILIIVLLIIGSGAALMVFKPDLFPVSLPFFKRPLSKEQAFDMGNKRLSFKELNGSFVDSQKAGKLFVVKGSVINKYPDERSFIRIRSNILDSKGKVVKSKIVYAGNPISDKELSSLSMEEVDKRLRDKFGKNKMNTNIPPNSSIPLMIVFGNLPQDLSEFEVEAISSSPAGK